jgi:TP901 family phage tail tape measure protein
MSDVNANIRVNISTQEAQAQLTALQQQISLLNKSMTSQMGGRMNAFGGQFKGMEGEIVRVNDAASQLNKTLAKGGNLKLGQSWNNFSGALRKNSATMQLAQRNAQELSKQYTLLGKNAQGTMTAFKGGQLANFNMNMAVSAQQTAILARSLDQMGTSVLNWGKNMQWAGRQLMVGFTVPLTIFGAIAIKTFKDVERQIIDLQKVYGDFSTSAEETKRVTESVRQLSGELTKLGFTAKDTLALAADAAAIGFKNQDLLDVTRQATDMAALGMMTQAEALNTMVSLNSAFGISVGELSQELDFMNAVENETILSMQDMAEAIPITATAVRGLGGDVRDLAVFLTAMREGGINANEAANSLKTSLARLITPTRQASETAREMGINLNNIVSENEGDLMNMIMSLSDAMQGLSDLQKQQLLSDLFGKRQFARMGALFSNIADGGSQAAKAMDLMNASAEDLAKNTAKELKVLEESPVMKLTAAMESFKLAIAPIGELFAKFLTPAIEFAAKVLDRFNEMKDFVKLIAVGFAALIGIVVPGLTMFIGLMGNLVGTLMNGSARMFELVKGVKYLGTEEIQAAQAAEQLESAQLGVNSALDRQASIVATLTDRYNQLVAAMSRVPAGSRVGAPPAMRFATGGRVPGAGSTDKVPALLTPGEFVVNKKQSQKNSGFLSALNSGSVKGFQHGGPVQKINLGDGRVINLNVSWPANEAARLAELAKGRMDAVEGNTEAQNNIVRQLQALVDKIEADPSSRTSGATREQREQVTSEFGTKGKFVGSSSRRLRSERLMQSRGFSSSGEAMADPTTAVEMSMIENRGDRNIISQELRSRLKKKDFSGESLAQAERTLDQLENSDRELTSILREVAENDEVAAADRRRILSVATQGSHNKSHAMGSERLPSELISGTVSGQNPAHLANAVGRGNSSVEFLGNYVGDFPGAVNKGMSGGKTMKGAEIQASILDAQQQGKRALETMRNQWLAYAKETKMHQDDIIAGLQRIDQAEDQFYDRVRNMTPEELDADWTEAENQMGGPSLNAVVKETIEDPLREGEGKITTALNGFVDTIKRTGMEARSKITQDGKNVLDALIAYQKGEATAEQKDILITAGHVDLDTGQLTDTAPRDVSYSGRTQSYSLTDAKTGQRSKWHTGGVVGDLTGIEEWLDVREQLGERIRREDEEAMQMYKKEFALLSKTNYKKVTAANAFQGGKRALKPEDTKQLSQSFSTEQIKKAEMQVKSLREAVTGGTISLEQFGNEFRQLDAAGQAVATTMYENTTAFKYMQDQASQAALAGTRLAQSFDQIANEQQAAQVRNLTEQFKMGQLSYDQYVAGLRSAAQASRAELMAEGSQSGKAIDDGLASFLQIKSPSRLAMRRAKEWIQGLIDGVRSRKGEVVAAGAETGDALDDGLQGGYASSPMGRAMSDANPLTPPKPKQKGRFSKMRAKWNGLDNSKTGRYGAMAGGQAVSMLSMGAYMLPGEEILGMNKQVVASFGMVAGQVNSFAAMFGVKGQIVAAIVTAIVAAIGGAFALWRNHVDKAARAAGDLGEALGGAANAAEKMGALFGKATLNSRRSTLNMGEEEKERFEEYSSMFEGEAGQALVKDIAEAGGKQQQMMLDYVKTAIIEGMIEGADAETFAKAFGEAAGNAKLGESVANDIKKFNEEYINSTTSALEMATQRSAKIAGNAAIQRAQGAQASGKSVGYKDAATVVGASMQAINSWSTVAAAAKEDYEEGIISYNRYAEVLDEATVAQKRYSDMLNYSIANNTDGGATQQAITDQIERMTGDEELGKNILDKLSKAAPEDIDQKAKEAGEKRYEERYKEIEDEIRKNNERGNTTFSEDEIKARAEQVAKESQAIREDSLKNTLENQKLSEDEINKAYSAFATAIAQGLDPATAENIAMQIADETSVVGGVYRDVLDETGNTFAAMQTAVAAFNNQLDKGDDNFLRTNEELAKQYYSAMGKSKNPVAFENIFSGMSESQTSSTLGSMNRGPDHLGGMGQQAIDQTEAALSSVADSLGPDLTDKVAPYVSEAVKSGMESGGVEGINELAKLLGGDQEALEKYLKVMLANGSLDEAEAQGIVDVLKEFKEKIPPEIRTLLAIDISNPEILKLLTDGENNLIEQLSLIGTVLESLPEEEQAIGAQLSLDENGKPVDTKTFVKDLRLVRKEVGDLEGKSEDEKIGILTNIQTTLNGREAEPGVVKEAYEELKETFGGKAVEAMDSITLLTAINSIIEADQLIDDAERLEDAAGGMANSEAASALYQQANELREAAATLKETGYNAAAGSALNPSPAPSGGGGGGGDSESNWIEQTLETKKDNSDYLKRLNDVKEKNLKMAKKGAKLSQEIMEAIAQDKEATDDYLDGKYSNKKIRNAYFKNLAFEEKQQNEEMKAQKRREQLVKNGGIGDYFVEQQILNDPELLEMFEEKPKQAIELATERAAIETTTLDYMERAYEVESQRQDLIRQGLELEIQRGEYLAENAFFEQSGSGKDRAQINQENAELEAELAVLRATEIDPIQDKIEAEKHYIKLLEREYEVNEDNVDLLQKEVEGKRRITEDMKRALEMRQREGQMLDHDLKLMDWAAEDIEESYSKRIEALDEIASLNQQIAQAQQDQLGLADALSKGDIGAAAQAAQQMQQNQMQFAAEQYRNQLEVNKENAVNNLTGAESGMTREQIEERQRQLEEDEYYTNLKIRDIEDEIYNLNIKIRDEQDIINAYKDQIETHSKNIRNYEWDIYTIQQNTLKPLEKKIKANDVLLAQADLEVTKANKEDKIALERFNRETAMWSAQKEFAIARQAWEEEHGNRIIENTRLLREATKQANEYYRGLNKGNGALLDLPTLKTIATTDLKTKDMTEFTKNLNEAFDSYKNTSASYAIPSAAIPAAATNGIMGITNNNYNNNVNINTQQIDVPALANMVMREMKFHEDRNTR